jgi:hypothetical protein
MDDPDLVAKNECVGELFAPVTGRDPYLNDSIRAGIDYALGAADGPPPPLEKFVQHAMELSRQKGGVADDFSMFHVNLRTRPYEPLWLRAELVEALKPMTGSRSSLLVVSGLQEAVQKALPRNKKRMGLDAAMAEARRYIDALGSRFAAEGCRLNILYVD